MAKSRPLVSLTANSTACRWGAVAVIIENYSKLDSAFVDKPTRISVQLLFGSGDYLVHGSYLVHICYYLVHIRDYLVHRGLFGSRSAHRPSGDYLVHGSYLVHICYYLVHIRDYLVHRGLFGSRLLFGSPGTIWLAAFFSATTHSPAPPLPPD